MMAKDARQSTRYNGGVKHTRLDVLVNNAEYNALACYQTLITSNSKHGGFEDV